MSSSSLIPLIPSTRQNFRFGNCSRLSMPEYHNSVGHDKMNNNGDNSPMMVNGKDIMSNPIVDTSPVTCRRPMTVTPTILSRQAAFSSNAATSSAAVNSSSSSSSISSSSTKVTSSNSSSTHAATSSASMSSSSRISKQRIMAHSMSTSEMNLKEAKNEASFLENRANYGRSFSLSGPSPCSLKTVSGPQRVFSMDRLPITEEMAADSEELSNNHMMPPVPKCLEISELDEDDVNRGNGNSVSLTPVHFVHGPGLARSFEQKQLTASKTKLITDEYSTEKIEAIQQGIRKVKSGDLNYEEKHRSKAMKAKLETERFTAENSSAVIEEQVQMKSGEVTQQEQRRTSAASVKLATEAFVAEKKAIAQQAERQTISAHGMTHQHKHMASSASSKMTFSKAMSSASSSSCQSSMLMSSSSSSQIGAGSQLKLEYPDWSLLTEESGMNLQDLERLNAGSCKEDVDRALNRYSSLMLKFVDWWHGVPPESTSTCLKTVFEIIHRAWSIPAHGHTMGSNLCDLLRTHGGLDVLIESCAESNDDRLQFNSARVLEQCLTTENRAYIAENGLVQVMRAAKACSDYRRSTEVTRVGTGILEHLFKHSESTCRQVIRQGGLKSILKDCRYISDVETLRHCSGALANLSLYGGTENHQEMINENVQSWLFPLAFHDDDNIKYYACLALATLVANKEIEAAVNRSGALNLVEPFLADHDPAEFAASTVSHIHGHSKDWLQRLVPVLNSQRKEAQSLAAFHFAMEAGIKKQQSNTEVFHEIGAIESLKRVASSPNAIASKYAAQALHLMDEELPHKLSEQVPLWNVEDVTEWLKQIGFANYVQQFVGSRVDGDLLLQLNEHMLLDDIGMANGILRKRFMRELARLKRMADYSSCDFSSLNRFLSNIGPEMAQYTYPLLNAGVDVEVIKYLTDEQLSRDCGIDNSIHRLRIMDSVRGTPNAEANLDKNIDVFISYRRSTGSQLASLLKVHLELRGFRVFIDVERLEAGKFDNNLLQSVRQAKHLILVLTQSSLDRCIGDSEQKDWIHREVVAALNSQCNIIPLTDNFQWPEPEQLPEDMRAVCYFNGVRWIHDYQEACVEKLERFIKGEVKASDGVLGRAMAIGANTPGTPGNNIALVTKVPGLFQRSQSNESKGSHSSDRELRDVILSGLEAARECSAGNGIVTEVE